MFLDQFSVLDGGVAQLCPSLYIELHAARMQVGLVVLGRGAAFDEVQVSPLVHDDQGMLELAGPPGVETEIGLEGYLYLDALGNVDEGTAGPYRPVQGRELVVRGRHQLHKVVLAHLLELARQGAFQIRIDHALVRHFLLQVVIDQLRVVLGAYAGQRLPLCLGDAQPFEGILDIVRDLVPGPFHICLVADVGGDVVHVQSVNGGAPVGNVLPVIYFKSLQPQVQHPFRIVLCLGDLTDDLFREALPHAVEVFFLFISEVIKTSVDIVDFLICHICTYPLRCRASRCIFRSRAR